MNQKNSNLPEFHPQTVLRDWNNGQGFLLGDALTGACIFGATGSGKTSGPGKHIAYAYLAAGFGGLVLCAKPDERPQWVKWAADCGRTDDLVIVNATGNHRFNFMNWEASRSDAGGGFTLNIVAMLDEIARAVSGTAEKAGGDMKFWQDALHNLNSNLVDLPVLAGIEVSLPLLRSIVSSAAISPAQALDPQWRENSVCGRMLQEADKATQKADPEVRADFEECNTFWTMDFPALADKTRSSILLNFSVLIRPLVTRPLRKLFSSDTNVRPEDAFGGKIIIVDLPVQDFKLVGRVASLAWKYCFQVAVLRRTPPAQPGAYLRPVFLWADEAHNFVSNFDAEYQAVARSAGGCTVYLTQNRESYKRVLGNDDAVDSLLGNLQAKFFCQNSGDTNEWAAKLLGERYLNITGTNSGRSGEENESLSSGITRSEQRRYFVEPSRFTTLKRGGANHNFQVEAICYLGGHRFPTGTPGKEELLPYKMLVFNQK
jgi:hypothetical protein